MAPPGDNDVIAVTDEKAKSRWDNVHTMVEAKCGLKWLLTVVDIVVFDLFYSSKSGHL